jgi:peptidylprolyl isomerase
MKKVIISLCLLIASLNFALAQNKKETIVLFQTSMGNIKIKLYNETPRHRDNMIKLVSTNYYQGLLFHRVIKDFMIQAGDPASKNAPKGATLGNGGPAYTLPAEFNPAFIHKKGALAAARSGDEVNPKKESSGSQFYIVQGKKMTDDELNQIEVSVNNTIKMPRIREFLSLPENKQFRDELVKYQNMRNRQKTDSIQQIVLKKVEQKYKAEPPFKYTQKQRDIYKTLGGTPFLDMNYTVFGEVVEGLDIVDKIAAVTTGPANRPDVDVKIISVKILP